MRARQTEYQLSVTLVCEGPGCNYHGGRVMRDLRQLLAGRGSRGPYSKEYSVVDADPRKLGAALDAAVLYDGWDLRTATCRYCLEDTKQQEKALWE